MWWNFPLFFVLFFFFVCLLHQFDLSFYNFKNDTHNSKHLPGDYSVPSTILRVLHLLTHLLPTKTGSWFHHYLQSMEEKTRHREVK